MQPFKVLNTSHLPRLAHAINLPEWLVEAIVVEYLPCRRFLEDDAFVTLDFSLVTAQDIERITRPFIILNGAMLIHNAADTVFKDRMLAGISNLPISRASISPTTFIAQGQVSPSYQPFWFKHIEAEDWKFELNIYAHALVVEEHDMFQWAVVTTNTPSSVKTWQQWHPNSDSIFSSEQLEKLYHIRDTFCRGIAYQPIPPDEKATLAVRSQLEKLYDELEAMRFEMRQTVFEYHEQSKKTPEARSQYTEEQPPLITIFDETAIEDHSFRIRTHVEPIFFRSAHRAAEQAKNANIITRTGEVSTFAIAEEIGAAAECIVLCSMCLEAYINGFAQDHLKSLWTKEMEKKGPREKWLEIPKLLGKNNCFDAGRPPFQDFWKLIDWRNNQLAHYKHEFHAPVKIKSIGRVSNIYSVCNAINAQKAIDTVRNMIERINVYCGFEIPGWIHNQGMWLSQPQIDLEKRSIGYSGRLQ